MQRCGVLSLSAATLLALTACRRPAETAVTAVKVAMPEGCSTELTTKPNHPFLAEFTRQVAVTCDATTMTLRLQPDPGGLGRVELVSLDQGDLAITDAYQSASIRLGPPTLTDDGLHEGKLDHYSTPCVSTQVFQRRRGKFLGAFDYCGHRWVFLRAQAN